MTVPSGPERPPPDPWRAPPDDLRAGGGFLSPSEGAASPPAPAGEAASRATRIAVLVTLLGAPAGLLWSRLSPHPEVIRAAGSLNIGHVESEVFLGADGSFLLVTAALGFITGVAVWWFRQVDGVPATLGMAVGALAAAKVAQIVGQRVVVDDALHRMCLAAGGCQLYDGTLAVRAPAVIIGWPLTALVTLFVLTAVFERRTETTPRPVSDWSYPTP